MRSPSSRSSKFIDSAAARCASSSTTEWNPAPGMPGRIVEPGHQFEWAWLLLRWGGREDIARARAAALKLIEVGESARRAQWPRHQQPARRFLAARRRRAAVAADRAAQGRGDRRAPDRRGAVFLDGRGRRRWPACVIWTVPFPACGTTASTRTARSSTSRRPRAASTTWLPQSRKSARSRGSN